MKTWRRGRKQATLEQKEAAKEWQTVRVKIANLVARKPEIKRECCICGNPGKILHNKQDPYYITFICDDCRKDISNLTIAEEHRFDIRTKLDKSNLSINNLTQQEVIRIVVGFMNDTISIGDYCNKEGISRHQFNQLLKRYQEIFPNQPIEQLIKNKSNRVQKEKLTKIAEDKSLF